MNKTLIIVCITVFSSYCAVAQNRFEIDLGIGAPPKYGPSLDFASDSHERQTSTYLPCFGASYERKVSKHIYIGGGIAYSTYSFVNTQSTTSNLFGLLFGGNPDTTSSEQVVCKASYITIAPIADIGLGRHQRTHLFLKPGIAFLTHGTMTTEQYVYHGGSNTADYDNIENTSAHLNKVIFPVTAGIVRHFRVSNQWHITLTAAISAMTIVPIANEEWTGNRSPVKPNHLSLQLGVMHKQHPHRAAKEVEEAEKVEEVKE